ncbi:hypothetical protein M422DRAFT_275672 [Sphaerobolus stellatus SS14]|uniref:Uncharacterized protein n=1 Tax=Sphaerobolus stellatus (strain SS14) TaxID=990650 RepID=A0A0C9T474_SPHS4|nr:hypothetical protein M422DRAFT_275672 [Sphaerobolus stellatus SS14]
MSSSLNTHMLYPPPQQLQKLPPRASSLSRGAEDEVHRPSSVQHGNQLPMGRQQESQRQYVSPNNLPPRSTQRSALSVLPPHSRVSSFPPPPFPPPLLPLPAIPITSSPAPSLALASPHPYSNQDANTSEGTLMPVAPSTETQRLPYETDTEYFLRLDCIFKERIAAHPVYNQPFYHITSK